MDKYECGCTFHTKPKSPMYMTKEAQDKYNLWGCNILDDIKSVDYYSTIKKQIDNINKPKHYNQYGIECIDAIKASMSLEQFRGYAKGNCIKYLWRKDYKGNAIDDLKKCRWYLDKLIESHEKEVG